MEIIEKYKASFLLYLNEKIQIKEPVNLYEPIHYIAQLGGKRLRPVLTLLSCELYNGNVSKAYDAALAIEVFHNFTLIHDDIMDHALVRRGKTTVHEKWNLNTGILSGDAMMIMAYQCFESYEPVVFKKLHTLLNKTALQVCEGQQLDVDFETRNDVTLLEYLTMITYKTSVLVAAAMKMGAIIANTTELAAAKIYDFGLNLGIAFQLQDDYLDTFGDAKTFGKKIGGDILENKKTYLYLKALEVCDTNQQKKLVNLYNSSQQNTQKIAEVSQIFAENNIPEITKKTIGKYTQKAFEILATTKLDNSKKEILKKAGLNLMKRTI